MKRIKPATKMDVARASGVSHMTVTRVLQNSPLVLEATRKKVLAACRRLNYRPNLIARSLRMHKSQVWGVVVPTLMHSYYARLISAIEIKAAAIGYHILVTQIKEVDVGIDQISFVAGQRVEGVFIVGRHCGKSAYDYFMSAGIPVVFLDNPGPKGTVFVGTDDYHGAIEATSYLISLGHQRIAHLAGRADIYTAQQRRRGYSTALRAHGIKESKGDILFTDYRLAGGYGAAEQILRSEKNYTAVFCANDYIAFGLLAQAYNLGIKVPEQISVVGFTGDEIGQYSVPPLTTMVQPAEAMGVKAAEYMLALMEGRRVSARILMPPTLLVRRSTAKCEWKQ